MKHTNQKGFSLIEIMLLLAIFCLVGLMTWFLYENHNHKIFNTSKTTTTTSTQISTKSASTMNGVALGIDTPTSNDNNAIKEIGRVPAIIDDFVGWKQNGAYTVFPSDFVNNIIKLKSLPMITWEPGQDITGNKTSSVLTAIASGTQDSYIRTWAVAAKSEHHPIYIRLMHEMNGGWYAWGHGVNGNTPSMYVAAFQHVVRIFQQEQANNVQFIWCVSTSTANSKSNRVDSNITGYYPGDAYTSWTAMDGYNRIPSKPKSFASIFSSTYSVLTNISKRPVMIPETATVEDPSNPNSKAQWIDQAFLTTLPNQFPKIKAVLYFDSKGNGFTYQIDTSPTTLAAIKSVFASAYYQAAAPSTTLSY